MNAKRILGAGMQLQAILAILIAMMGSMAADDQILVEAGVNDQPVRLTFDTGAEATALYSRAAKRLNVKVSADSSSAAVRPGSVPPIFSEKTQLSFGESTGQMRFLIVKIPPPMKPPSDGVLAWYTLRKSIIRIDAAAKSFHGLPELPADIDEWRKWPLIPNSRLLAFNARTETGEDVAIHIDTGTDNGIQLSGDRWKKWRSELKDPHCTNEAAFTPGIGLRVYETCWADKIVIGDFSLKNMPVIQNPPEFDSLIDNLGATVGLHGLSCFDVIVDGKNGFIYVRTKKAPTAKYQYNRLGAVFVPAGAASNDLVAHVVKDGPAHRAGIRNGDFLLRINKLDVTKWRSDPRVLPLWRFWSRPAGTRMDLTIGSANSTRKVTVKLKEIFPRPDEKRTQPTSESKILY